MKKVLSIILALVCLLAVYPSVSPVAQAATYRDFEYTVKEGEVALTRYVGKGGKVTIPSRIKGYPVTEIGQHTFNRCDTVTAVTIPNSIKTIGYYAFCLCTGLTRITIPKNTTEIDRFAFSGCSNLKNITVKSGNKAYSSKGNCLIDKKKKTIIKGFSTSVIPTDDSVTKIGFSAFDGCEGLTAITIPGNIKEIGSSAFRGCTNLRKVTLENGIETILFAAFNDCPLTSIAIPSSVTLVQERAFNGDAKTIRVEKGNAVYRAVNNCLVEKKTKTLVQGCRSSVIPDDGSVTKIGEGAFFGCSTLKKITLPDSITEIDSYAFKDCKKLKRVTIPDSVTYVYNSAFSGCTALVSIRLPQRITDISNALFSGCVRLKSITIPAGVTSIGNDSFENCKSLTSITIPKKVKYITAGAFSGCSGLKRIRVAKGNKTFRATNNCLIHIAAKHLELGCKTSVIPTDGSVTAIDSEAFAGCTDLKRITIPEQITRIYHYAFNNCSSLKSITIPKRTTYIGEGVFRGNDRLTRIRVKKGNSSYAAVGNCLIEKATKKMIAGCKTSVIPDDGSVTTLGQYLCAGNDQITQVVIPKSITTIRYDAFSNGSSLKVVYYEGTAKQWAKIRIAPDYIKYLGDWANKVVCLGDVRPTVSVTASRKGIHVSWKRVDGADKYRVYRRAYVNGKAGAWERIDTTTKRKLTDSTAKRGVTYRYMVRAVYENVASGYKASKKMTRI